MWKNYIFLNIFNKCSCVILQSFYAFLCLSVLLFVYLFVWLSKYVFVCLDLFSWFDNCFASMENMQGILTHLVVSTFGFTSRIYSEIHVKDIPWKGRIFRLYNIYLIQEHPFPITMFSVCILQPLLVNLYEFIVKYVSEPILI